MNKQSRRTSLARVGRDRIITALVTCVALSSCLDFDQYAEGSGGTGGTGEGGASDGGSGGGLPTCPSDPFIPASVCILGSPYLFDDPFGEDWGSSELGGLANGCDGNCATISLTDSRVDLRTMMTGVASNCFVSIDLLPGATAPRAFLELVPDGGPSQLDIPLPNRDENVEISVEGDTVFFEVGTTSLPALVLDSAVVVDQLRIQVRDDSVVLEAFAGGEQVACSEQPLPPSLSGDVRAGFGVQGSNGQQGSFDNFGTLAD